MRRGNSVGAAEVGSQFLTHRSFRAPLFKLPAQPVSPWLCTPERSDSCDAVVAWVVGVRPGWPIGRPRFSVIWPRPPSATPPLHHCSGGSSINIMSLFTSNLLNAEAESCPRMKHPQSNVVYAVQCSQDCTDLIIAETKQHLHKGMVQHRRANSSGL